jgi:hypothetical protein
MPEQAALLALLIGFFTGLFVGAIGLFLVFIFLLKTQDG